MGIIYGHRTEEQAVQEPETRRRAGRPREVVRREPGVGVPLGTTLAGFQPTTRAILAAAQAIVLQHGVHALTLTRVAEAAHVDVTTVTYHFGTRSGLLEALIDSLYGEPLADFIEQIKECQTASQRVDALFHAIHRELSDRDGGRVYASVLVQGVNDEVLRKRLAKLNTWTIEAFVEAIYGESAEAVLSDRRALATMQLLAAAIDGIELHGLIDPDGFEMNAVLELLRELLPIPATASERGSEE